MFTVKEKMENVLKAFSAYLESNNLIEIVFTKKHGYLFLWFNEDGNYEDGVCIENDEMLSEYLFSEIRKDVCRSYSPFSTEGIEATRREIERYIMPLCDGYQWTLDKFIESLSD